MIRPQRQEFPIFRVALFLLLLVVIACALCSCAVSMPIGENGRYGTVSVAYKLPEQVYSKD
jgi:hypothetical protein